MAGPDRRRASPIFHRILRALCEPGEPLAPKATASLRSRNIAVADHLAPWSAERSSAISMGSGHGPAGAGARAPEREVQGSRGVRGRPGPFRATQEPRSRESSGSIVATAAAPVDDRGRIDEDEARDARFERPAHRLRRRSRARERWDRAGAPAPAPGGAAVTCGPCAEAVVRAPGPWPTMPRLPDGTAGGLHRGEQHQGLAGPTSALLARFLPFGRLPLTSWIGAPRSGARLPARESEPRAGRRGVRRLAE